MPPPRRRLILKSGAQARGGCPPRSQRICHETERGIRGTLFAKQVEHGPLDRRSQWGADCIGRKERSGTVNDKTRLDGNIPLVRNGQVNPARHTAQTVCVPRRLMAEHGSMPGVSHGCMQPCAQRHGSAEHREDSATCGRSFRAVDQGS
jgi:hypothetical protein